MEELEIAGQLDAAVFEYRRILTLDPATRESPATRRAALAVARELARVTRGLQANAGAEGEAGEGAAVGPPRALDALRVLQYGFVALAQDPVDEPTVLSGEELDAVLLRDDVGRWMHDALHGPVEDDAP
jgi:hypothetical protein